MDKPRFVLLSTRWMAWRVCRRRRRGRIGYGPWRSQGICGTAIQFSARRVWICACCAGLATATLDVGVLRPSCRCAASFLKPMALAALGSRPSDSRYRCRGDRTMLFKLDAGSWLTRENIDLIVVPYNLSGCHGLLFPSD